MDQTYGFPGVGDSLHWYDNAANHTDPSATAPAPAAGGVVVPGTPASGFAPRPPQWATPPGWIVYDVVEGPMGGKFTIYVNSTSREVMIDAMGTNGNGDLKGWETNTQSYGQQQWVDDPSVQAQVFAVANAAIAALGSNAKLIITGDSKGGALAQFIISTLLEDRASLNYSMGFASDTALKAMSTTNIGIIGRVGPGSEAQLGLPRFLLDQYLANQNGGIQAFYSATKWITKGDVYSELVSQTGGPYLHGDSNFYVDSVGIDPNSTYGKANGGSGPISTYTYLHRIGYSDYDAATATGGNFGSMFSLDKPSTKQNLTISAIKALGVAIAKAATTASTNSPAVDPVTLGMAALSQLANGKPLISALPGASSNGLNGLALQLLQGVAFPALGLAGLTASTGQAIDSNATPYQSLAAAFDGEQIDASGVSGGGASETFHASATSDGVSLTGSSGDTLTASVSGGQIAVSIDGSASVTATLTPDGQNIGDLAWNADGAKGDESFAANGSSTTKTTAGNGSYVLTTDDGWGNVTTDYYTASDSTPGANFGKSTLYGDSYVHADGTSGSDFFGFAGRGDSSNWNLNPGAQLAHVLDSAGGTVVAPDGSYQTYSDSIAYGIGTLEGESSELKTYDNSGKQLSDTVTPGGEGLNLVTADVGVTAEGHTNDAGDGGFSVTDPQDGSWTWGDLSGTWNPAGATAVVTQNYTSTQANSTLNVRINGDVVIDNLDPNGTEVSQDFWKHDGTHGVVTYTNGKVDNRYTYQTNGQVEIDSYSSGGTVINSTTEAAGAIPSPDGSNFQMQVIPEGNVQQTELLYLDSSGTAIEIPMQSDGSFNVEDSSDIVAVAFTGGPGLRFGVTDGSGTLTTNTLSGHTMIEQAGGKTLTVYLDASGHRTGEDWTASDGTHGTTNYNADGSSEGDFYNADGSFFEFQDDGQGNIEHDLYDASGNSTGDVWWASDGSSGSDAFNVDGTSSGTTKNADGTVSIYGVDLQGTDTVDETTSDGTAIVDQYFADGSTKSMSTQADGSSVLSTFNSLGDSTVTSRNSSGVMTSRQQTGADGTSTTYDYDANGQNPQLVAATTPVYSGGVLQSDSWFAADGSTGTDAYTPNSDGTTAELSTTNYADGTSKTVSDDGEGDVSTTYFDANGKKTNDTWSKVDGSYGTDVFAADGSSTGTAVAIDGTHGTYARTAARQTTTSQFDASDTLTEVDVVDSYGTTVSRTTYAADGSYTVVATDAVGNVKTTQYAVGGIESGDTWTNVDGTSGSDVFAADGSETSTRRAADGSYDVTTSGAQQLTTTTHYDAQGNAQWRSTVDANGVTTRVALGQQSATGAYDDFVKDGEYVMADTSNASGGVLDFDIRNGAGTKVFQASGSVPQADYAVFQYGRGSTMFAGVQMPDSASVAAYLSNGTVINASPGSWNGLGVISAQSGEDSIGFDGTQITGSLGGASVSPPAPIYDQGAYQNALADSQAMAAAYHPAPSPAPAPAPAPSGPSITLLSDDEFEATYADVALPNGVTAQHVTGESTDAGLPSVAESTDNSADPNQVGWWVLTDSRAQSPAPAPAAPVVTVAQSQNFSFTYGIDGGSETDVYEVGVNSDGSALVPVLLSARTLPAGATTGGGGGLQIDQPDSDPALGGDWSVSNDTGEILKVHSELIFGGGGMTAQLNFGGASVQLNNAAFPFLALEHTAAPAGSVPHDVSAPAGYGSVFTVTADGRTSTLTFGTADDLTEDQWTTTDGSRGEIDFAADGSGTGTIDYADGNYSDVTSNADGTYKVDNHSADGTLTSDLWSDTKGEQGKDFFAADGSSNGSVTQADGTYSTYTDDGHGDRVVSYFDAQGNPVAAPPAPPAQPTESVTTSTAADGTVTTYDTVTQADGSFTQTTTATDGSRGTVTYDAATGEVTGSDAQAGSGFVVTWDDKPQGGGVVDSTIGYAYDDGSTMSVDKVTQADGSYAQQWTKNDGTSGTTAFVAATGENSGSTTDAQGNVNTWDTLALSGGATESKTGAFDANGSGTSYDTITQTDNSFTQTWTSSDGSHGTNSLDAATGETTGTSDKAGAGFTVAWDTTSAANGASETKATYDFGGGSTVTTDAVTQVDGASEQAWTKSDGSHGTNATGAHGGSGDTFTWGVGGGSSTLQTFDGADRLSLGAGIDADQLWFRRDGNDLDIAILGTNDQLDVQGWYGGADSQLRSITLSSGQTLAGADVQKLVDAMSGFAVPDAAQSQYTPDEKTALQPVLAANWH